MSRFQPVKSIIIFLMLLVICTVAKTQLPSRQKDSVAIYLTFDDGPLNASWRLLSFLRTDSIPVDVFLVGQHVFATQERKDILRSYRNNPLIEIDNHSFSHTHKKYKKFYRQPKEVIDDILLNEDTLQLTNKIVRLPGRNVWRVNGKKRNDLGDAKTAADSLAKRGYKIFGWDLEWRYDTARRSYYSAGQMIRWIRQMITTNRTFMPGQVVILCHDPMMQNEYARLELGLFARQIKAEPNWHFEHLRYYPRVATPL